MPSLSFQIPSHSLEGLGVLCTDANAVDHIADYLTGEDSTSPTCNGGVHSYSAPLCPSSDLDIDNIPLGLAVVTGGNAESATA